MTVIASFPHESWAFFLFVTWLAAIIAASYISDRKGYGERPGIASGMLLSLVAPIVWFFVPARPNSRFKDYGLFGRPDPTDVAPEAVKRPAPASPPMGRPSPDEPHSTEGEVSATVQDSDEVATQQPATEPATTQQPVAEPETGAPPEGDSPKAPADREPGRLLIGDPDDPAHDEDLPELDRSGELALEPGETLLDAFTGEVDARARTGDGFTQLWRLAEDPLVRVTSQRLSWIGTSSLWRSDGRPGGSRSVGQLRFARVTALACYPSTKTKDGKARIAFTATGHAGSPLRVAVAVEDDDARRLFERWAGAASEAHGGEPPAINERNGALHADL